MAAEDETFGEYWIRTVNALTALSLQMQPHPFRLPNPVETLHTDGDQPGPQMGATHYGKDGNETETGR